MKQREVWRRRIAIIMNDPQIICTAKYSYTAPQKPVSSWKEAPKIQQPITKSLAELRTEFEML